MSVTLASDIMLPVQVYGRQTYTVAASISASSLGNF